MGGGLCVGICVVSWNVERLGLVIVVVIVGDIFDVAIERRIERASAASLLCGVAALIKDVHIVDNGTVFRGNEVTLAFVCVAP